MPSVGVLAIGLAVLAGAYLAPPRWSFAVLVFTLVLIPPTLVVPNGFSSYLTCTNLAVLGASGSLLVRWRHGELPTGTFAPVAAQGALALFLAISIIDGLGLAGAGTTLPAALHRMNDITVQLAVLTLTLAIVRVVADRAFVLHVLAGALVVSAGIAAVEHITGGSWGHFLFAHRRTLTDAADLLEVRRGNVRVRAGAEFALEYAWVTVMLLPALVVHLSHDLRHRVESRARTLWVVLTVAATALTLLSLTWSYTRSALALLPVVAVLAILSLRGDRRIQLLVGAVAVVILGVMLAVPSFRRPITPSFDQASIDARTQRAPRLLDAVAHHPLVGLGIGATGPLVQAPTTDASFLEAYAELGMLGVVALALAVMVPVGVLAAGWRREHASCGREDSAVRRLARSPDGLLLGAAAAGVAAGAVGAFAFDLFALVGAATVFWVLVGAGLGAAPATRCRPLSFPAARACLVPGALAVGVVLWLIAPARSVVTARVVTLPGGTEAVAALPGTYPDRVLGRTICAEVKQLAPRGSTASCRDVIVDLGVLEIRVESGSLRSAQSGADAVIAGLRPQLPSMQRFDLAATSRRKPSWATTAPWWMALLGLGAALWLPIEHRSMQDAER